MALAGATLTIAALAFIAGTLGAWWVYTDLRDSKRRFDARQRLGLDSIIDPYALRRATKAADAYLAKRSTGLESYVPAGMRRGQQPQNDGGHA